MKKIMMVAAVVSASALCGAGLYVGAWLALGDGKVAKAAPAADAPRVLFYRNPMNPAITSPTPAKDEMGMDYIPVYEEEPATAMAGDDATVTVAPELANNLGVRTAIATRGEIARRIETVGYVGYDEDRLSHVHLRAEGWIEDLHVHAAGEGVTKGQVLFHFYSPELANAQEELLQAIAAKDTHLAELSRQRLEALGIPRSVVAAVERSGVVKKRLPIQASQNGVVGELNVRDGMFVPRDMDVMTLADLESVWLLVDVFEQQAAWVQVGQRAQVRLAADPGRIWEGRVEYIYPEVDPRTRTLRVRLRFTNPGAELKPNMYAIATIFADARTALNVPREAVIRTERDARVILARGDGRFAPVVVRPGIESSDRVEILEGLQEGDKVVVSAQFLIDSEASLRATLLRMASSESAKKAAQAKEARSFQAAGIVKAVDVAGHKLNITHEPIPALGWPAMTMDFGVARQVELAALKPGTRITFEIAQRDPVTYEITALQVDEAKK